MKFKSARPDDSQLNMTPMIDIVFQLILFFLFSLRFKSLDFRIETNLPHDFGVVNKPKPTEVLPHLRASLSRIDVDDPLRARTKLKLAGSEWVLPDLTKESEGARDVLFRSIEARMLALRLAAGMPGEIDCPEPTGSLVPHGDVVRVIDAFLGAGITEVNYQGAKAPMPRRR